MRFLILPTNFIKCVRLVYQLMGFSMCMLGVLANTCLMRLLGVQTNACKQRMLDEPINSC